MLQVAKSSFVPVLFGHALDDDFIRPHHSDLIYEAYVVSFQFLLAFLHLAHCSSYMFSSASLYILCYKHLAYGYGRVTKISSSLREITTLLGLSSTLIR